MYFEVDPGGEKFFLVMRSEKTGDVPLSVES
jgi:hypothetical protein